MAFAWPRKLSTRSTNFLRYWERAAISAKAASFRCAHTKLAAFAEIAARSQYLKKFVDLVDNFRGQANAIGVARHCKQSFFRAGVVKTLHRRTQKILRNHRPDLARSDLFDRVRFIQNQEIVRE